MRFVALDVESANADMASICQIGIAQFAGGTLSTEWKSYVDPQDDFDAMNTSVHGIDQSVVAGAPTFDQLAGQIGQLLIGQIVVTHTHFDRVSILQASGKWDVPMPDCRWLDSAKVARRAWAEFAQRGYGLANVCRRIGYEFQHHDALEDAKAAAQIILAAIAESGLDLDQWAERVCQPLDLSRSGPIVRDGNPGGALYGEILVFTGSLRISRREAADIAARAGCQVGRGVTRDTTLLIVGDRDIRHAAGHSKSGKHRRAEELILRGIPIRILQESDFIELIDLTN